MTEIERIKEECARLCQVLTLKNAAYGNAAASPPLLLPDLDPLLAILVRMSDKISRLRSLISGAKENDESFNDTIRDLAGYCVLYLAFKNTEEEGERQ